MKRLAWAAAFLLAAAVAGGLLLAPRLLLAVWLAAWWWALGLVLGCHANAWMSRLSGGRWGEVMQAGALRARALLPWLLLALLPIAVGHAWLYPWAGPAAHWLPAHARPGFLRAWLSPTFFLLRLALYALGWWWLTRPVALQHKGRAALALVLYTVLGTLAAVDLLMSLLPGWYSTAFGLVVLSVQALAGSAAATLVAAMSPAAQANPPRGPGSVPVSRDLGNLLLMWVMTWAYLAFMQFLIIWAENLPREIAWYVPRLQTGWQWIGLALVFVQLVLPFVALLFRSIKDRPRQLARIAALLLFASALDVAWTVLPSVDAHNLHGWWMLPLTLAGMGLLLFGNLPAAPHSVPGPAMAEGMRHARS
jgi:hypothetical protein